MMGKLILFIFLTALILIYTSNSSSEMTSENYGIRSYVLSAGGIPTSSGNYQTNNTIGQPSPLMDSVEPPLSDNYDLYPGFWYTVANIGLTCPGDFNGDKDVDGSDLMEYILDSIGLGLEVFAPNFGKENCP